MSDLQDRTIQNLAALAAHALSGKPFAAEPMQMAELWAEVASAQKYLADKKAGAEKPPAA